MLWGWLSRYAMKLYAHELLKSCSAERVMMIINELGGVREEAAVDYFKLLS
jgi:hypothetical protein